jgi:microcin C transport system permease protein
MVGSFATLTILTKNSLMENLGQDYIRTAFAKGLSEHRVIFVHALRNSLIPLATGLGHVFGLVLAGSFLIEKVFNIDGMGYLGYTSILQRDYPVALGILVISSLLMLLGNILSDVIYTAADPRIRFK